ncbi:hypothetical protein LMG29542_08165 [Paraburkholderia humisilvae]|uniref:Uncharacterized protein n=1 Tax=Paraburkholderia humisilvae TaxID=627669 RepID=A0A6J5F8T6_9BURK|nr:hypothetical protein LMG29542_08165 [Paraburkholderia humisilvae]
MRSAINHESQHWWRQGNCGGLQDVVTNRTRDEANYFELFPLADFDYKSEIYKDYAAPIFRRSPESYSTDPATFGIVSRKHIPPGVTVFDERALGVDRR